MELTDYHTDELIYRSNRSQIHRVHRKGTGERVILKTPGPHMAPERARELYRSEFRIGQSLDSPAHVRYFACGESAGSPYLLIEDFDGVSLSRLIPERGFDIADFLPYAVQITDALAQLHHKKIIHKDLCPSNIAVNPRTGTLKLIDFGAASPFLKEIGDQHHSFNHATLAFISPEQTGRMNRLVTYRTDFYSLGVTFFQLLTGRLPFAATESNELIYHHIAAPAPGAKQFKPSIPSQLNELVAKLMQKNPEERYHSALGLLNDLERCQEEWRRTKAVSLFPLGAQDVSEVFTVPEKLYGRSDELARVKRYFRRAVDGGFAVCYIAGRSGIGKSAFVNELYKDIAREKGHFGSGKFDQFQRNIPYSALIHGLSQIIQSILTEPRERIAYWRDNLQSALGNNAGVLASVLPELELIMGKLETVEVVNPELSRNRFILAFRNLIRGLSQPDAPLVLFLDDLQWIDAATLQLFSDFFNSVDPTEKNHTMIIGAYRDNEVDAGHPLSLVFRDFEQRGFPSRIIELSPLDTEAVSALCADAFEKPLAEVRELACLLQAKTGGSPFFVKQFLETLYERELIFLNRATRSWDWRQEDIQRAGFTDNVLYLIQGKLQNLGPQTRRILQIAACLGNYFEAADIVAISGLEAAQVDDLLSLLLEEDIIYRSYTGSKIQYRFQHDRIQNAAYQLVPAEQLDDLHLRIGLHLIGRIGEEEQPAEQLFEVLQHLNRTESLIEDEAVRLRLARRNLEAGEIAKRSNAHQAALAFARHGIRFLSGGGWQQQYDLTRRLHLIGVQNAYLIGDYDGMHEMAGQALTRVSDPVEKVAFHEIITYAYASRRQWPEAVGEAIKALGILGIRLPKKPGLPHVLKHLARFHLSMGRRQPEDLLDLPELDNPRVEAALKIFISATSAAYLTSPNMFAIFFTEMARLSARYGNGPYAAFAYVGFGVFYGGALGFVDYGFRFGELGKKVFEKYRSEELLAKIYFSLYAFLQNWKVDVKELYPKLLEGFQVGSQVGESEYAAWCLGMRGGMSTLSGEPLAQVEQDLSAAINYARNLKQIEVISRGFRDYARWWLDETTEAGDPLAEGFIDEKGPVFEAEKFYTALAEHDLLYGSIYFHYFRYEDAWRHLSRGWQHHKSLTGLFYFHQLAFYRAWCALKLQQEQPGFFKARELKAIIRDFSIWGKHSVPNHGHKLTLFEAEQAVLRDDKVRAMELFDAAIYQARRSDHPNDEAAFAEITARHYQKWGKPDFADLYLQSAYGAYERWGARRKLRTLVADYPFLRRAANGYQLMEASADSTSTTEVSQVLDVESMIKASQAISGEIRVDTLLQRLLAILSESAGAQRVVILLAHKGKLRVEARKTVSEEAVIERIPLEHYADIPHSLIHYIEQTKSTVVLEAAQSAGAFTRDPYIAASGQQSILGMPILRQGALQGIIYMDNRLTTGAFTTERTALLQALSTQVAISLENANAISEMRALNRAYDRFVPKEFLRLLGKESILDVKLGDQQIREMIVLFADIRNFTGLSETIPADETFALMNDYLKAVTPAIHRHGGTVDKFMGDGIMALFPDDADAALAAAVNMQQALESFNRQRRKQGDTPIRIGIGLHAGTVTLGTVGTEQRLSTTVIGDPVNLAARLEQFTKVNSTGIQVSGELVARLRQPGSFNLRQVGFLKVRGKANKIKVYEEFSGYPNALVERSRYLLPTFEAAIKAIDHHDYREAAKHFDSYLAEHPQDKVAQYYRQVCDRHLKAGKSERDEWAAEA